MKAYDKGCFAIYYDISKAYDTMIRWSSTYRSGNAGDRQFEKQFVSFVLAALAGSRVAIYMRTNVSGNVTREVTLSKSIKQGCPLAPLLFIIVHVMDELRRGLRIESQEGLRSGRPEQTSKVRASMVSSRGYCDDTYIVAHTDG